MTKCLRPAETAHSLLRANHLLSECLSWLEAVEVRLWLLTIVTLNQAVRVALTVLSNLAISM